MCDLRLTSLSHRHARIHYDPRRRRRSTTRLHQRNCLSPGKRYGYAALLAIFSTVTVFHWYCFFIFYFSFLFFYFFFIFYSIFLYFNTFFYFSFRFSSFFCYFLSFLLFLFIYISLSVFLIFLICIFCFFRISINMETCNKSRKKPGQNSLKLGLAMIATKIE